MDYSGITYKKLTGGSGIPWPCNEKTSPNGTERLYTEHIFPTSLHDAESYGHHLPTGTPYTLDDYVRLFRMPSIGSLRL
jgi:ferredoxin-nitrate reductase